MWFIYVCVLNSGTYNKYIFRSNCTIQDIPSECDKDCCSLSPVQTYINSQYNITDLDPNVNYTIEMVVINPEGCSDVTDPKIEQTWEFIKLNN